MEGGEGGDLDGEMAHVEAVGAETIAEAAQGVGTIGTGLLFDE